MLLSNSVDYGRGYLDHAEQAIRDLLVSARRIAFVPFAASDLDGYAARARARFERFGCDLASVHEGNASRTIESADAIFVGGGNTFRLLHRMYASGVIAAIRERVAGGAPYIGSSAGSIVAGPTLKTTKDMPIVQPPSFDALRLVPFQISPHYLDPDPASTHMGETQEERILQFLEENDTPVVGLREGSLLRVEDDSVALLGAQPLRLFRRGCEPVECPPGPVQF